MKKMTNEELFKKVISNKNFFTPIAVGYYRNKKDDIAELSKGRAETYNTDGKHFVGKYGVSIISKSNESSLYEYNVELSDLYDTYEEAVNYLKSLNFDI